MAIVGLTHEKSGVPRIHRTVNCKVAIGLPPEQNRNYPVKLDHFVFLKQEMVGKDLKWVVDEEKQKHYGEKCREFWVVFLGDDPEEVFRTEYAAYIKTRCWCRGDGETAMRRERIGEQYKGEFKVWPNPCANHGCPDAEAQGDKPAACKPSADLYFMLADFPTLGTICRIHTSSYQSIRQIYSALQDLRAVTGGRLMGVRCKLFVQPARNVFEQGGVEKTGTKFVLGLELAAKDIPELMESMSKTALMFQGLQKQLAGRVLEIEEDEAERAAEITPEFYGPTIEAASLQDDPEKELRAECDRLMEEDGHNKAYREAKLGQYAGKLGELKGKILATKKPKAAAPASAAQPTSPKSGSDDDLGVTEQDVATVVNQPTKQKQPQGGFAF
jgi:Recombination directionality factor-like